MGGELAWVRHVHYTTMEEYDHYRVGMRRRHGSHVWTHPSAPSTYVLPRPRREERDLPGGVGERAAAPPCDLTVADLT